MPLLSTIIFLPLVGALSLMLIRGNEATVARNSRQVAFAISLLVFALSMCLWWFFEERPGFQFVENRAWIPFFQTRYHLGIDGISLFFVLLTTLLMPLCILSSWRSIENRVRKYMMAFLVLETFLIGMFCALDLVIFYIFFEAVLIPMVLLIGIWGGEHRIYACFKFFLYTLFGSVLMLVAIMVIYSHTWTTDLPTVIEMRLPFAVQAWVWWAFFIAFAVKIPMWPLHTWLPDAHVEAPTAGSVILAGVLLKMGGYGLLRFSLPLFPEASLYYAPFVIVLSLIAIVYTSLVALVQTDIKKLIAYSSVAHMGFVTLGIFTFNSQAVSGAVFQMLSHGIVSAALFLCVGVIYDRFHTREIKYYGGLVTRMPRYAFFFMLFTLASLGLPGTSGFVGEFLVIVGVFSVNMVAASIAATAMVLGASYGLWLYRRIIFGTLTTNLEPRAMLDLDWREIVVLGTLAVLVLLAGIHPQFLLKVINPAVQELLR
ncbi:MAG: NADH-quinone oxidoreductase subunit M [Alphaproteobacteria bacterium]